MKHLIYIQFILIIVLSAISSNGNAAIATNNSTTQDSALLIIKERNGIEYIESAFKKGDLITYRDKKGKHLAKIIGFRENDIIIQNTKSDRIHTINPNYIKSIRKRTQKSRNAGKNFTIIGLSTLLGMLAVSASVEDGTYITSLAVFIILGILLLPVALLIGGIYYLISINKRPIYSIRNGYKFKLKK